MEWRTGRNDARAQRPPGDDTVHALLVLEEVLGEDAGGGSLRVVGEQGRLVTQEYVMPSGEGPAP